MAEAQPQQLEVTVPDGVEAGGLLTVTTAEGNDFEVTVPDGLVAGDVFLVDLPDDPPPPPLPPKALQQAVAGLTERQADIIRAALLAIEDSAELDDFVNSNADEFGEYVEGWEQKLEYQTLYNRYVVILETIVEETLQQNGATTADLYEVLQAGREVRRPPPAQRTRVAHTVAPGSYPSGSRCRPPPPAQDKKTNLFLDRFIAMESYDDFCAFMGEWSTLTMWQRLHVNKDQARKNIMQLGR